MVNNFTKQILIVVLMMSVTLSYAQQQGQERNEIKLIFSDATPLMVGHGLAYGISDVLKNMFGDYKKQEKDKSSYGMWGVGYRHQVANRIHVGGDVGFIRVRSDIKFTHKATNEVKLVGRKVNYSLILPSAQIDYLQKPKVHLYSSIGAGLLFIKSTEQGDGETDLENSDTIFAFQINPVAIRVGQKYAGFAELGFGMKGIFNIGASMRF